MFVWVDVETTGLNPEVDEILEVGLVITDDELVVVDSIAIAITPGPLTFGRMGEYVRDMHRESGLLDHLEGKTKFPTVAIETADLALKRWLERHDAVGSPMAGSSVAFDRSFLNKYMPKLASCFHYRNADVSALREFARCWWIGHDVYEAEEVSPLKSHRVIDDIYDSIRLARFYKRHLFISGDMFTEVLTEGAT
jgi:oligoribonuclease